MTSLAVPATDCGAGQLSWEVEGSVPHGALNRLAIPVALRAPAPGLQGEGATTVRG
ncbi:MAG TPA: hypothetical protein VF040_04355 [Ktedonobacterales bacterium]